MSVQELRPAEDDLLGLFTERLRALDANALAALERGMQALADGDFTEQLDRDVEPFVVDAADARMRALVDLFNGMQTRLQASLDAYEQLRRELSRALGDQSCLPELLLALQSLNDHCLTDLDAGLQAMADGDLTYTARPATHPLRAAPGDALGEVGEVFNDMLARSRTALRSYEAVREDLRLSLGDHSCIDPLRIGLRSLQRHCLRDLEEALEAVVEGTALTRPIGPVTNPIETAAGDHEGELAALFNRALQRARTAVDHMATAREERAL